MGGGLSQTRRGEMCRERIQMEHVDFVVRLPSHEQSPVIGIGPRVDKMRKQGAQKVGPGQLCGATSVELNLVSWARTPSGSAGCHTLLGFVGQSTP